MKELQLADLTIEQKIGLMLIGRDPNTSEKRDACERLVRNHSLGAVHISKHNPWLERLRQIADYPLLICENMETGFETKDSVALAAQLAVGATDSEELAYQFGRITALDARKLGFNLVFGPIVDIAMNPASTCVGTRSFGGDRELVAKMACAAIRGYQDQGLIVTAKHYPGFGESKIDSHIAMVVLRGNKALLKRRELFPYVEAMKKADLSGVMVGHIMVPKVDPVYPASLSPTLIKLLRDVGYNGLIMTDSLAMVGLTNLFPLEQCHGMAMAAGNDLVMTSYRIDMQTAYDYMLKAYRAGQVSEEQVNAAVTRVLAAMRRTLKPPEKQGTDDQDRKTGYRISAASVTARLNGTDTAHIPADGKYLFIVQKLNQYVNPNSGQPETGGENTATNALYDAEDAVAAIRARFPNADLHFINEWPSISQVQATLVKSMQYEKIVMVNYAPSTAYSGSADLAARHIGLMEGIAHKLKAVVLFGNPYAARHFPRVERIIFGYEGGRCAEAAFGVLAGELPATGKLPVNVEFRDEIYF